MSSEVDRSTPTQKTSKRRISVLINRIRIVLGSAIEIMGPPIAKISLIILPKISIIMKKNVIRIDRTTDITIEEVARIDRTIDGIRIRIAIHHLVEMMIARLEDLVNIPLGIGEMMSIEGMEIIEEVKIIEEAKIIEEVKIIEEARIIEEVKIIEEAKITEEVKIIEEARIIEEVKSVEAINVIRPWKYLVHKRTTLQSNKISGVKRKRERRRRLASPNPRHLPIQSRSKRRRRAARRVRRVVRKVRSQSTAKEIDGLNTPYGIQTFCPIFFVFKIINVWILLYQA